MMVVSLVGCDESKDAGTAAPAAEAAAEWKPSQPITIMNHVAVGGAMDLYSRKTRLSLWITTTALPA